ncbi:hypothetical protein NDU88_002509 [Pleurodeles waltl]|uniref:Uncharacterized protein n=1 Tax=Pleurodeles waltl TaxID=8319 RepID=A0AAV7U9H6_PLEWA|nr:hypothetical protein NDU88_002509 [Pleurodeles waltl]
MCTHVTLRSVSEENAVKKLDKGGGCPSYSGTSKRSANMTKEHRSAARKFGIRSKSLVCGSFISKAQPKLPQQGSASPGAAH